MGEYQIPYAEFKFVTDFQVLMAASQGQFPTIPEKSPQRLKEVIQKSLHLEPEKRPSASELFDELNQIRQIYNSENEAWNVLLQFKK